MKTISAILLLCTCLCATAQAQKVLTVDFDQIRTRTGDLRSPMYYPALSARFESGDSLSFEELRHLYYGSVFTDAYDPYSMAQSDEFSDHFRDRRFREALAPGLEDLARDPTNIRLTFQLMICYHELGVRDSARLFARRYHNLLDVIKGSGDGSSPEKAMVVMRVTDEYEVLSERGLHSSGQALINSDYGATDRLEVAAKEAGDTTGSGVLYFNVQMPIQQMTRLLENTLKKEPGNKK